MYAFIYTRLFQSCVMVSFCGTNTSVTLYLPLNCTFEGTIAPMARFLPSIFHIPEAGHLVWSKCWGLRYLVQLANVELISNSMMTLRSPTLFAREQCVKLEAESSLPISDLDWQENTRIYLGSSIWALCKNSCCSETIFWKKKNKTLYTVYTGGPAPAYMWIKPERVPSHVLVPWVMRNLIAGRSLPCPITSRLPFELSVNQSRIQNRILSQTMTSLRLITLFVGEFDLGKAIFQRWKSKDYFLTSKTTYHFLYSVFQGIFSVYYPTLSNRFPIEVNQYTNLITRTMRPVKTI